MQVQAAFSFRYLARFPCPAVSPPAGLCWPAINFSLEAPVNCCTPGLLMAGHSAQRVGAFSRSHGSACTLAATQQVQSCVSRARPYVRKCESLSAALSAIPLGITKSSTTGALTGSERWKVVGPVAAIKGFESNWQRQESVHCLKWTRPNPCPPRSPRRPWLGWARSGRSRPFWSSRCKSVQYSPIRGGASGRTGVGSLSWLTLVLLANSTEFAQAESLRAPNADEAAACNQHPEGLTASTKPVLDNFKIIRMPGDGRCLFHAVTHGACVRSGLSLPSPAQQTQMADELRNKVADEFVKRREETEWFIEGNFDSYVRSIRMAHVWGGEPELLMMSHVLRTPITVYIRDPKGSNGLISIAEYGQDYATNGGPISVFYNGSSHYDALEVPGSTEQLSKL